MSAESVINLLRARLANGGRRPFADQARVALCIEGGAMRGVVSAGMVSALSDLGYADMFDAVYGSSAGAISGAYFLAGQAARGTTVYYEDINRREFIDFRRILLGRPVLNLEFLFDEVAQRRKPLDARRVLQSETPLRIMATDVETASPVPLADFETSADLLSALRASSTMPVLAGGPFTHRGRRYLDASLSEPVPVPQAEADGYSHLLVLLTRPTEERPGNSAFDRLLVVPRLRRISPALADRYANRSQPYAALNRTIRAGTGPAGRAHALALRPRTAEVDRLERRRSILEAGAAEGRRVVIEAFRAAQS
ncbi:MAG: patatin family protein [Acidobacteria bacterium]|nr:patatin family protein [Acidobacteriota bacterium]